MLEAKKCVELQSSSQALSSDVRPEVMRGRIFLRACYNTIMEPDFPGTLEDLSRAKMTLGVVRGVEFDNSNSFL